MSETVRVSNFICYRK